MAVLISFMRKYRIAAITAFCLMLIELAVELVQPVIISKIIDEGIAGHNLPFVWLWGGVLVGSALLAFTAGISSSFFASHTSQGFGFDLRDELYRRVQSITYSRFQAFQTSSLITRLTGDITQLQDMVFMSLRFASRVPLIVIGSIVFALFVHFKLGMLLAVTGPVLFVFVVWMMKKSAAKFKGVQQQLDRVNNVIQENLTGMRLIRIFVRTAHESSRFAESSRQLAGRTVSALRLTETTMPFALLLMNSVVMAVLWFGRAEIAAGSTSIGEVVAVLNYALRTIGAISALSWIMASISRAAASGQRVREVLAAEDNEDNEDNEDPTTTSIATIPLKGNVEFEWVSFQYPGGGVKVLEDVSFSISAGQRVAILGATGSGKSSLVQMIPGLYEPNGGVIRIDGTDIREWDSEALLGGIGYVPQEVTLFSGTVRDNIAWGMPNADLEQIQEAARQAQIHDTIMDLPQGYDSILGQRGINLSGGQKQRLSIARALIRRPAILIMDDSTSALDVRTEGHLLGEISKLSCTTLLVTQKISSAVSADMILLLDEGRVIASGNHEKLLTGSPLYRRIYESQYGEGSLHVQSLR